MPSEKPSDVFLAGCARLGEAFAGDGFVFRKAHPKLTRKLDGFTEEVRFTTSRYNEAGELVQLRADVVVSSPRMAAWRKRHPAPLVDDFVGGTALANLLLPETDWNLAARSKRARVLAEAERAIRDVGLPYLALLRDPAALERRLLDEDLRGMSPDELLDPLVCFGGVEAGARYAAAVLARHRDMAKRVLDGIARSRRKRKPPGDTANYFDAFAARLVALGVPFP